MKLPLRFVSSAVLLALAGGCGMAVPEKSAQAPAQSPAPATLSESLFSKDARGALSEADLQRVLDAPVDLEFPARLGVVALADAFSPDEPAGAGMRATVARAMTRALGDARQFSSVTDVSTGLPNPSGIEGLRTISARYRARYLLLVNTVAEDHSHLNNWAWLYATGVGVLLAPGQTVESRGYVQASLLDVKTGTLLYTVLEPFESSSVTWLIGGGREHERIDANVIANATRRLSRRVVLQTSELERWNASRRGPPAARSQALSTASEIP